MTRVVIVDDHQMFRSGVRAELGDAVEIVGDAADVESAIEVIRATGPDVVLLDVHMPGGGGKAVLEAVAATHPDVRFLALSVSDAAEDVIAIIRAGARGYVTKTISGPELADAVRRVADGDAVFSPRLKYPSLVLILGMHASIAVLLGLPYFSLFMLVGDAVFLSDRVWRAVERGVAA